MESKILKAIQEGIKLSFMLDDTEFKDEDYVKSKVSKIVNYVPYELRVVDLGLSVDWCEYNLGAIPENDPKSWYGNYYAWGELEPKSKYAWSTYKFYDNDTTELTKYNSNIKKGNIDGLLTLEPEDDVIYQTLGDLYRMPTVYEYKELLDNTTLEWKINYKGIDNLNGLLLTAKNSNTLFLPACGQCVDTTYYYAQYNILMWVSSLMRNDPVCAAHINIDFDGKLTSEEYRYVGAPVRGVKTKFKIN